MLKHNHTWVSNFGKNFIPLRRGMILREPWSGRIVTVIRANSGSALIEYKDSSKRETISLESELDRIVGQKLPLNLGDGEMD